VNPRLAAALLIAAAAVGACGKQAAPKVDAATEQAQAHDRARQDAFGAQVKAVDDAKALGANLNATAGSNVDKAEAAATR
jgi:hypothetical protein